MSRVHVSLQLSGLSAAAGRDVLLGIERLHALRRLGRISAHRIRGLAVVDHQLAWDLA